jgi:hypothetical protein
MFSKVTLAVAIILSGAAMASAATKHDKMSPRPLYDSAVGYPSLGDSDSPAATGGGSIGYNQNIYNW